MMIILKKVASSVELLFPCPFNLNTSRTSIFPKYYQFFSTSNKPQQIYYKKYLDKLVGDSHFLKELENPQLFDL